MAAETWIRLIKNFAEMTVVRLFLHFFDLQRRHDDRMPCAAYSVSSVFALGDALNSSIGLLTDQRTGLMNLFAISRLYYSGNQTQTWYRNQHNMCAETSRQYTVEGSGEAQKIFIFGDSKVAFWFILRPIWVFVSGLYYCTNTSNSRASHESQREKGPERRSGAFRSQTNPACISGF